MTDMTFDQGRKARAPGAARVAVALLIGWIAGSAAAVQLGDGNGSSIETAGAPAALATGAATTAGQQYLDWYTRGANLPTVATTAGQQYLDWYTRDSRASAPSTTASRQYLDWYTRDSRRR